MRARPLLGEGDTSELGHVAVRAGRRDSGVAMGAAASSCCGSEKVEQGYVRACLYGYVLLILEFDLKPFHFI